jgi:NAD-dependent deacetylase
MQALVERLAAASSVFVLTGSGMSAESGLPTFRGAGGFWRERRFEELASPQGFAADPQLVWEWYNERIALYGAARPNPGHEALAALESIVPDFVLATQNVDSLHRRAGSRNVLELHGNLREARCNRCAEVRSIEERFPYEQILHACGGRFRPGVVWFGEALPQQAWAAAQAAAERAEVILVVGTSGVVYPAAALATAYNPSAFVIEINPGESALSERCTLAIREGAATALPAIVERVQGARRIGGP